MINYPASDRGHFDFGWLDTNHTFSFGHYMNTERMNFGMLRVFNDDVVAPGEGFGTHPHNNMEIISIPLEGVIMHRDSMGHEEGLRPGDVQVMSAGTGLTHSEYNGSATEVLKFLQIWIIPNARNVEPRYDQVNIGDAERNVLHTVVGPKDGGAPLWINQDAWLSIAKVDQGTSVVHTSRTPGSGIFVFVVEGSLKIDDSVLTRRDAVGITDKKTIEISATSDAYFIVIDVPLA
jgi:redox-sensitive bicupin YhaK (pirin superfamily)